MSRLLMAEQSADPSAPASQKVEFWLDNSPRPKLKSMDDLASVAYQIDSSFFNGNTAQLTGFSADQYLVGSSFNVAAGAWRAGSQYRCRFDMAKSANGVAAWVVTLRMGTAGTVSDAAICTFTGPSSQTAAADQGIFEFVANFRSVGSGTSAVLAAVMELRRTNTTTGLLSTAALQLTYLKVASSGFNSTTPTFIGMSFNGGASFAGTVDVLQAALVL